MSKKTWAGMHPGAEAPCRDCEKRYPGCHDKCEPYSDFKKEVERIHAEAMKSRDIAYVEQSRYLRQSKL